MEVQVHDFLARVTATVGDDPIAVASPSCAAILRIDVKRCPTAASSASATSSTEAISFLGITMTCTGAAGWMSSNARHSSSS